MEHLAYHEIVNLGKKNFYKAFDAFQSRADGKDIFLEILNSRENSIIFNDRLFKWILLTEDLDFYQKLTKRGFCVDSMIKLNTYFEFLLSKNKDSDISSFLYQMIELRDYMTLAQNLSFNSFHILMDVNQHWDDPKKAKELIAHNFYPLKIKTLKKLMTENKHIFTDEQLTFFNSMLKVMSFLKQENSRFYRLFLIENLNKEPLSISGHYQIV